MPPWPPSAACNDYVGDRSLSAEQKQLFRTWIEDGKLEGDPARPAPPLSVEKVELSRVDLDLAIEQPYVPRTTAFQPDDYRCFVIPWPETATTHVTGFRAVPGNPKVVHHVIAFLATPAEVATYQKLDADEEGLGYTCFGGSGGPARKWLGGWAPGTLGQDAPPGTGLRVEPGSVVILQVHYNVLEAGVQPDQTTVQFKLDDAVDKEAEIVPWANPRWPGTQSMRIAAGDRDATHSFQYDASVVTGGAFTVYSSSLHMHTLGSHATASIERAGGGSDCLLQIDDWNFHWQGNYDLRQPVQFQPGDQLKIECHWDNSPENQPLMNGELRVPADVFWGEGTTDEMCLGVFYVTTP